MFEKLTIREALQRACSVFEQKGLESSRQEAEVLFSLVLGMDRLKILLEGEMVPPPSQAIRLENAVLRRAGGEPTAYIAGSREFYGLEFTVNPEVLIPRPESELLIESALGWAGQSRHGRGEGVAAVDLGTGSGNLAITLAVHLPRARIIALDISAQALETARENARRHGVEGRISWCCSDYFSALSTRCPLPKFNLVISNPPYIPREDLSKLPLTVSGFEPRQALDGGADGLDGYRKILSGLPRHLVLPALVVVEIGAGQSRAVAGLFKASGLFQQVLVDNDYQGRPRVVHGFTG